MMKRSVLALAMAAVLALPVLVNAAETSVHGRVFAHWYMNRTDGANDANEFGLGRAYITLKSKLSEFTSVRVTTDLRENVDQDSATQYDIILKYGYIDWKPEFAKDVLVLRLGLQPTPYIDYMNKLWGRRYLSKTVGDLRKYLTTSDLGASANVGLGERGKIGSVVLAVFNGTSYSSLGEENKQKDINGYVQLTPFTNNPDLKRSAIVAQIYHGVQNELIPDSASGSDYKNQLISAGGLLAYRQTVDVGVDLNWHTTQDGPGMAEVKESGLSFFGTFYLADLVTETSPLRTLNVFGRVDLNDPNTDVEDDGNTLLIAGVECAPVKGFKASVNYRTTSYQDDAKATEKLVYLNTLFDF